MIIFNHQRNLKIIFNFMDSVLSRIQQIADNENIKITKLEQKIGASKGVLSRAIANGTDIQSKWLQIIVENYPIYNTEWLLTGKGAMLKEMAVKGVDDVPGIQTKPLINLISQMHGEVKDLTKQLSEQSTENKHLLSEIENLRFENEKLKKLKGDPDDQSDRRIYSAPTGIAAEPGKRYIK